MDKTLLSLVLVGVLIVVVTNIIISTKIPNSSLHPDLPASIYIPGIAMRVIGICALLIAFLCPMGWVFDGERLKKRTGKWYILVYISVAMFFVLWSGLLICTVRQMNGCEYSSAFCIISRLIITQIAFCFVAFANYSETD